MRFTMSSTTGRILLALFISLLELTSAEKANHPLKPRNVRLLPVENGLKVTWETPKDSENRPVEHYSIGYGKSMKHLRFIKVEKDIRSYIIEDVEPGVLYFVQMTAENHNGVSHPVYRAETSGGGEWVNLDGFAIMGPAAFKGPMTEKDVPRKPLRVRARPSADSLSLKWRAPHLSGQNSTVAVRGYLLGVGESGRKMHYIPLQQDQRNHEIQKLASESVYVVSLQAQNALGQSPPVYRAVMTKKKPSEPDELYEPKDISVRVMSPQSVFVSWVDPVYEKQKKSDISSTRHYTIRYREKGESARWDYKHATQRRVLVDKLSPDNMYEFSVQISQGERDGKWSVSVFQRTPESAPTGSPENFEVQPLKGKGTAVTATWEPPLDTNGKIREYILSYAPALKPFGAKSITYRGDTTSAIIEGLQPGDRYIFKIRAANRRGQGPQSKAFSVNMPTTSTVASSSHQQSRNPDFGNNDQSAVPPSRTSLTSSAKLPSSSPTSKDLKHPASKTTNTFSHEVVHDRSQLETAFQSKEEPDESELYPSEPVLPSPSKATTLNSRRKNHPISRSPVRIGQSAIKQRPDTTTSSPYFKDKDLNGRQHTSSSRQTDLNEELDEELDEDTEEKHKELLRQKNTVHSKLKDDGHSDIANKKHSKSPNHKTGSLSVVPETSSGSSQPKFSRTSGNRSVSSIQKPHTFPNSETSKPRRPISFSNRKSVSPSSVTQSSSSGVSSSTLSGNQESTALKNEHSARSFPNIKETYIDLKNGSSSSSSKSTVSKSGTRPSSVLTSGGARLPVSSNRHSSTGFTNGRRTAGTSSTDSTSSVHQKGVPDQPGSTRVVGGQQKPGTSLVRSQSVLPTIAQPSTRQQLSKPHDEDYDYESSETEAEEEKPTLSSKPNHALSNLPSSAVPKGSPQNSHLGVNSKSTASKSGIHPSSSVLTSGGARSPVSSNRHSSTGFTNGRRTAGTGSTDSASSVHQKGIPDQPGSTRVVGGQQKPGTSLVRSQSVLPTIAQPSTRQQSSKPQDEDYNYEDYDYESSETEVEEEKPTLSSKLNHALSNLPSSAVPKGSPRNSHLGVNSKSTASKSGTHPSSSVLTSGGARLPVSSNRHSSTGFTNGRRTAGTGSTDSTSSVHQKGVPNQPGSTRVVGGQQKPGISLVRPQSVLPTIAQPSTRQQSSKPQDEDYNYEDYDYESSETEVEEEKPTLSSKPNHALSNLPSSAVSKGSARNSHIGVSSSKKIDDSVNKHSLSPTSRVNPSSTKRLPSGRNRSSLTTNRNHRFSRPRQETKLSSSSTQQNIATPSARSSGSQSLTPKHTQSGFVDSVNQETDEKERTPISSSPSKFGHGLSSSQSSVPNRHSVSSGSRKPVTSSHFNTSPSSSQGGSHTPSLPETVSEDDDYDYQYYGSKELYDKVDKLSSASVLSKSVAPDPTTSPSVKQTSSSITENREEDDAYSKSSSPSVQSSSQLPTSGSNGRSHSSQLTNRQFGPRISSRVLPSQNSKLGGSSVSSSSPSSSASQSASSTNRGSSRVPSSQLPHSSSSQTSSSSLPSLHSSRQPIQGTRTRYPGRVDIATREKRPGTFVKPSYKQGKNGRPNLTDANGKVSSTPEDKVKQTGRRLITGPQGAKWIVDLDRGVLMNQEEKILQDSHGNPLRVQLGADGRSVIDHEGTPLLNPDGLPLFGHRRDSSPVISPKGKSVLSVGGKPLVGLELRITTTIPPTTTTTTTTATTTTTPEPTIIPTTIEITTDVPTTPALPECPPGTYYKVDEDGKPVFGGQGILNCYPEEAQTTLLPTTEAPTTKAEEGYPETRPFNTSPSSEFDLAGKRRFTAPYVNYIRKDPGAPCSLTEALEYLQVDILEDLFSKDRNNQPPKNKPHNITVVAMEGCHSFVILDWARPVKGDMVSGYMVHSASYDDILNNRWSTKNSSETHLAVENLKPNSRYYFKVQAKNNFGLGPISDTFTYVTESDDPLLIVRPPGGEPIWIPFSFKYTSTSSECKGSQYVKRTWYKKFVGVVLCNSLRYKIFMGDGLKDTFYSIGDTYGRGEDHCQFVDSHMEGRTGPRYTSDLLPTIPGFYRAYRQEPVHFGLIGSRTPHYYVGWYECGVPIPGKW